MLPGWVVTAKSSGNFRKGSYYQKNQHLLVHEVSLLSLFLSCSLPQTVFSDKQ